MMKQSMSPHDAALRQPVPRAVPCRLAPVGVACILLLFAVASGADVGSGYYRFPDIHDDTVVFTAEGDLWTVPAAGGTARRLTTHHGVEADASVAPDGTTVAFTAQYEGNTEVYTMPLAGGLPRRWTYGAVRCRVIGWTPDGRLLYKSRHLSTLPSHQLIVLDPATGLEDPVPLAQAADGAYDARGRTLFFARLPFQGSHTKRYQGGTAEQLWKYVQGASEAVPLTGSYPGTSRQPEWWAGRVYFASDRDGTMNLWSMDEEGGDLRQHTHHAGFDVKDPGLGQGRIVYQLGADLRLYDIAAGTDRLVPIQLASDFDQTRTRWIDEPMEYLSTAFVSPDGGRVALTARGRVFVAPVKQGRFVEVTREQGIRYRSARFMPDGKTLLLQSDATGEVELWTAPADGRGEPTNLTRDADVLRNPGVPSPDGKWVAFTDRDYRLWLLDVERRKTSVIDTSDVYMFQDLRWSPDSRFLAYVGWASNEYARIYIRDLEHGRTRGVTTDRAESYSPTWSPDGKWLYFLSDRHFSSAVPSPWGPRQPEPFFPRTTGIYHLALQEGLRSPFLPDNELAAAAEEESEDGDEDDKEPVAVRIDFDGLERRLYEVPVEAGAYGALDVTAKHLYFTEDGTSLVPKRKLVSVEIRNHDVEKKTLLEEIGWYELSDEREHVLLRTDDALYVLDAGGSAPDDLGKSQVDLSRWSFGVEPRQEWRQMFVDAWRMERDYFYDPGLHGVDWQAALDRHLPLVERLTDRYELDDLLAQMVGELAALHIFVFGGDKRQGEDDVAIASLGARLARDERAGGYRVERVYRGDPDYPSQLSPLQRPDVGVRPGDLIRAINGVPILSAPHPAVLLSNQVGRQVLLSVKRGRSEARDVIVEPISAGRAVDLRYDDWEYSRRLRVEEAGEGRLGYVHLRAMGSEDVAQWARDYYPVFDREGLIVDVRHNAGGNIDSWILSKLLRQAWFYWQGRRGKPTWNMQYAFRGHLVVLCNEMTASDGEAFTEGFRRLGLGPVIGTRTWGGEIWLSLGNRLVDRGIASAAEWGVYGPEGEWLIEGHGVEPDIVVDNLPHATYNGQDAQLEAAIADLKQRLAVEPVPVPPPPPYPVKAFDYPE